VRSPLPTPYLTVTRNPDLGIESTVRDLTLHGFNIDTEHITSELANIFARYPSLPGAILYERGLFAGMLSRRRFLECLIRPYGWELFSDKPLRVLYTYAQTRDLIVSETATILGITQLALRRPQELAGEPIVVQMEANQDFRLLDIQELYLADWQIRGIEAQVRYESGQAQMIQHEKMASLGRLVDGVAHEILDPINFIWGNLNYLNIYSQHIFDLVEAYEEQLQTQTISPAIARLKEEMEFDFLVADLPKTINSIRYGAERLKKLVISLQNFCHIDEVNPKPADIHSCLDSIVLLLQSRLKGEIEIVTRYGNLPPLSCFMGQLNQVFVNLISHAIDTLLSQPLGQASTTFYQPKITISTKVQSGKGKDGQDARWVSISIANNGPSLSRRAKQKLIDSFSPQGKLQKESSLSLSYWIITARHGGRLELRSPIDSTENTLGGAEFEILLPLT